MRATHDPENAALVILIPFANAWLGEAERELKSLAGPLPFALAVTDIPEFFWRTAGLLRSLQRIAGHADSRTTKLYDRGGQKVLLEDMERIRY